jgi:phosphoenolpyruvate-protein phosphotransferase (PTS system enzyme I)
MNRETVLYGKSISPGIGIGVAWREELLQQISHYRISQSKTKEELKRFHHALHDVKANLHNHITSAHGDLSDDLNQVLKAHEMMLYDQDILQKIENRIARELKNAEWAVDDELESTIARFEKMRDPYLQARAEDMRDFGANILKSLSNKQFSKTFDRKKKVTQTMITRNLFPSLAMKAHKNNAAGFATESPALFSHAAILLKDFGIPAVGNVENLLDAIEEGDEIIIDGLNGLVIVRPEKTTRERFLRLRVETETQHAETGYNPVPTYTSDGVSIELMANIEHPNQIPLFLHHKLEGIGLFRTEFLALEYGYVPSEDDQCLTYRNLIERAQGGFVVIRTFDIGADKNSAGINRCTGMNPALGVRGIRRHLHRNPEELRVQLRAILKASLHAQTAVLFPMITDVNDVKQAKEQFFSVQEELKQEGIPFDEDVKIGAMIEVPSAAILTSEILSEVDFISVGTNDLLQYFTGADRDNPDVLSYYDPGSPAFAWLLEYIIKRADELGRKEDVTVCGEMAGSTNLVSKLIRVGYRSLSISPVATAQLRTCISRISTKTGVRGT